ncbi:YhdH/YhfP family quinone oxidoreductase [Pelosinus fermentans]|uniref:Quinone oxidoreductase, YhdH/YhfP family n=2 Tax=Sporomusaceae TaxID=1843490 RepID=I8RDJ1_9FIRM|nr:YhdH/YhfP family quinone oxidoreductase [Pelosinus fermentans]EIW15525.1 quinone oxidoreductase, YhdH/YhfP family [Pelosinus fermentans B4]EIW26785.1 quinone oxidoreductase, YhdH/YhfP family [Pelosinus fermentans A11]OAM92269.1 quinone oxidoreductase, YhdH/YhfP family [Pelosinus fermentans DSM 17108]SDQ39034.1 putative quinone oxidoreductase, YhdH/YhfP family [Pelosinus fermentans]
MSITHFKAMLVTENTDATFSREIINRELTALPEGEVLIQVKYSSLNYKDALSASGNKGVTRKYPHTPGIDAAGIVVKSSNEKFQTGDEVLVTGYDLGMNTSGGYGQYIRVPAEWVVKLLENLSLRESMIYGTAGFTAALSVYKMIQGGIKPDAGNILVTGATGGVGSIAVSILHKLGYSVIAATGKAQAKEMLLQIGAKDIILREELNDQSGRILLKGNWAGVIDTVGGNMLATALKSTNYGGSVTCCGNVASPELLTSVYPFILRGITLYGVDSVMCPMDLRLELWSLLATEWKPLQLEQNVEEVSLEGLDKKIDLILQGKLQGRTIVNLDL